MFKDLIFTVIYLATARYALAQSTAPPPSTTVQAPATTVAAGEPLTTTIEVKGGRYCELVISTINQSTYEVTNKVYNTQGLGDCPDYLWNNMKENATDFIRQLRTFYGMPSVVNVFYNGPRYWLLDAFLPGSKLLSSFDSAVMFGGMGFRLGAYLVMNLAQVQQIRQQNTIPYVTAQVNRSLNILWKKGQAGYFIKDSCGNRFIMQSYSLSVNPDLTESDLTNLSLPKLPRSWSYSAETLSEDLIVSTLPPNPYPFGLLMQDEFQNTYLCIESNLGAIMQQYACQNTLSVSGAGPVTAASATVSVTTETANSKKSGAFKVGPLSSTWKHILGLCAAAVLFTTL